MSDLKLDSDSLADEDEYDSETSQDLQEQRAQAKTYVCAEITRYAVEILNFYNKKLGKNDSLALTIESLAESLGSLISLVHEDHQEEVLTSSLAVMREGITTQTEVIAQLTYGQVGHA